MAVGIRLTKGRGKLAREARRTGTINPQTLEALKNKYSQNAAAAADTYKTRLSEYINWYIPQIENYALYDPNNPAAIVNSPNYFENSEAGQDARIRNAVAVAKQTAKLAEMWRRYRRLGSQSSPLNVTTGGYAPSFPVVSNEKVIRL